MQLICTVLTKCVLNNRVTVSLYHTVTQMSSNKAEFHLRNAEKKVLGKILAHLFPYPQKSDVGYGDQD